MRHCKYYTLNTTYIKLHKLRKKLDKIRKNLIPTKLTATPYNTKSYNTENTSIPYNRPTLLAVNNRYTSSYTLIRMHY